MFRVYVFLSNLRPRSVRAKTPGHYKEGLRNSFRLFCPEPSRGHGPLYAVIYYFHRRASEQDADNISKPVLDALEGLAYEDDRIVRYRQAAMFDLRTDPISTLDMSNVPRPVLEPFLRMLSTEDHVLYVELGRLSYAQIRFGYEAAEEI